MSSERSASKSSIEKLVRFFEQNIYQLKSPSFNETQARQQLIDPFFEALGWDVHNRKMNPVYLQEVIPEGRVKTSVGKEVKEQQVLFDKKGTLGKAQREYASILDFIAEDNYKASWKEAIKKPDYRFRIKGKTKFFVEAKKPFVDLSKSTEAIFQAKRYGFSGRVPVSILTDFEQFRTFDCTRRPEYDKPMLGVIKELDLTYKQYLDQFDRLYDTFSHEAVEAGSLDTLTRKLLQKKTGDFALDKHFLEDLSQWREELARDIAKHPKNRRRLSDYTLNESVQRILDRIVFFRVCEDREIEVENTLLAILRLWQGRPGVSLYSLLNDLFKQRRALYNGLLFAPHECEELEVGDDVLLKILEGLNYPFSPYYFNEIGVEILGSIYEKFLGKTIHLTPKTVRVEEKPEVRKAGGVYYTPQYIVNYIVDNTVGKLLYEDADGDGGKRKLKLSPKQVAKLRIIDIACGSGSFLLGAFQKLIDYHTEWYHEHPKGVETAHNVPDAYMDVNGSLRVSSRKKRDILLNNIYGVDIDRQAVEVTQMSLYLKVLEGENAETLNPQMTLALKEAYLPSLDDNIKCGNSLIGTDISSQADLFDSQATQRINPFDWETEFAEIMKRGGFDAVIGNPPWISLKGKFGAELYDEWVISYLTTKYKGDTYRPNMFEYFVKRAMSLTKFGGIHSYIVPDRMAMNLQFASLRKQILAENKVHSLLFKVPFPEVIVDTVIYVVERSTDVRQRSMVNVSEYGKEPTLVEQADFSRSGGYSFGYAESPAVERVLSKIEKESKPISSLLASSVGFIAARGTVTRKKLSKKAIRVFKGENIRRYGSNGKFYFEFAKKNLVGGTQDLHKLGANPKILLRKTGSSITATLDENGVLPEQSLYLLHCAPGGYDLKFFLAILNSKMSSFYYWHRLCTNRDATPQLKKVHLDAFPFKAVDLGKSMEKKKYDDMLSLVDTMLGLHLQLNKVDFDSEKEPIQRQIAATDKKIDKLVYELYGLTEEEIKIVEGGSK